MPAEPEAKESEDDLGDKAKPKASNGQSDNAPDTGSDDDGEEEDEPRLKYTKLTASLTSVYRNGDATSSFLVAGDKMIIGTHNGNIHALGAPPLHPLRFYHAHSASITALSISPVAPVASAATIGGLAARVAPEAHEIAKSPSTKTSVNASPRAAKTQSPVPNIPSNQIYIASASVDGHVCVSSLVDPTDVTLRNFARPVQAVALSPEYKTDRIYVSGGLAGNLILTVDGKAGVSAKANTNSAAAAASGWLGSIGLGSSTGKDTILHSGEGSISTIKFSHTGKFVAWVNEKGIKIMRSHLKLESVDADSAWKRIAHIDRPKRAAWDDMAGVWKGRMEWISDQNLEADDEYGAVANGGSSSAQAAPKKKVEKLVVGWGDTSWVLHVQPGGTGKGKHAGERSVGSAEVVHKLTFDDCIISGLSLYTPSLLAILAYRNRDDDDNPISAVKQAGTPRRHRSNGLPPELRLVNVTSGEETDVDTLSFGRCESLSAADYHLGTLYIPTAPASAPAQRGALESLSAGFWDVGNNATRMFSSGASANSGAHSGENGRASALSPPASGADVRAISTSRPLGDTIPPIASSGLKMFVHSPYDCILAVKRHLSDHLDWLMQHRKYADAWDLVDEHPSVIASSSERQPPHSNPSTPSMTAGSLADFFADENASQSTLAASRVQNSAVAKEKRRIGDLWLQQLVSADDWKSAGSVAGKVLGTPDRWEHWVLAFAQAGHFDEITPYIPSTDMKPALPSFVYEVVLGHYIDCDRPRFQDLLNQWDPELFDITSVVTAIDSKLESNEVTEDTVEDGEIGRDWRILLDGLAKLDLAGGKPREALRCFIRLQNADAALSLIRDYRLVDAIADDIPGLLMLRVRKEQLKDGDLIELKELSSEPIRVLVDEAYEGVVQPEVVVTQLQRKGDLYQPFLHFFFEGLWNGPALDDDRPISRVERLNNERKMSEGRMMVEQYADLAVSLFADHDRDLLMSFLRHSTAYTLDKALTICENKEFIPELVYLLSKTGQTRRALFLIIDELGDVSQAIAFAKDHPDLWNDLLDYSMSKPRFIRALLSEVGTSIDPVQLIRRIPDGLEVEGLKDGIQKMVREYDIQFSISEGASKVFRGEVSSSMDILRTGQKKAVKFEVMHQTESDVEVKVKPIAGVQDVDKQRKVGLSHDKVVKDQAKNTEPGHCVGCHETFDENDQDFLVGFACGHVFHLQCLLYYIDATDADFALVESLQDGSRPDERTWTRSVGAKISHAQIIRSAIKGGCPVCIPAKGAET